MTRTGVTGAGCVGWSAGMSDVTNSPATSSDTPAHRYTATLAQDIELRWQDWWDEHHTFETPNTAGPLADADLAQ